MFILFQEREWRQERSYHGRKMSYSQHHNTAGSYQSLPIGGTRGCEGRGDVSVTFQDSLSSGTIGLLFHFLLLAFSSSSFSSSSLSLFS